ncbi:MAG: sensor histidine kinase [Verrucomicrobiota bacterium]
MNSVVGWLAFLSCCCAVAAGRADESALTNIGSIRKLSYADAKLSPRVKLEVTVTSHLIAGFDAQDQSGGIFFEWDRERPGLGDHLRVFGRVTAGLYGPYIVIDSIEKIGKRRMPRPLPFRPNFMSSGLGDNRWVEAEGLLVQVSPVDQSEGHGSGLLVNGDLSIGIRFRRYGTSFDLLRARNQVGKWVTLRGSGAPVFNNLRQRIGAEIICSSNDFIRVIEEPPVGEMLPLDELGRWDTRQERPSLVLTSGVVTWVDGPRQCVIQSGGHGARISWLDDQNIAIGSHISLKGLPAADGFFVGLQYGQSLERVEEAAVSGVPAFVRDPDPFSTDFGYQRILVQGVLLDTGALPILKTAGNASIPLRFLNPKDEEGLPPAGSQIELGGVKLVDAVDTNAVNSVQLGVTSLNDLVILSTPSKWTPRRYWTAIGILGLLALLVLIWSLSLRRVVSRQTLVIQEQTGKRAALEERNRIARELHDTLSQGFSGVGYQLASVERALESDLDRAHEKLVAARQMVEHSLAEARDSVRGLRLHNEEDAALFPKQTLAAAAELCQATGVDFSGPKAEDLDHRFGGLTNELAYACHRIVLEAVTNCLRHSGASEISLNLKDDPGLTLILADNGRGFDPAAVPADKHFGIQGMRERAQAADIDFSIQSTVGDGTTVTLSLPNCL